MATASRCFESISRKLLNKNFDPYSLMNATCERKDDNIFSVDEMVDVQQQYEIGTNKGVAAFCKLLAKLPPIDVVYVTDAARALHLDHIAQIVEDEILRVCLKKSSDNEGVDTDQTKASVFRALVAIFDRYPNVPKIAERKQRFIEQLEKEVVSWYTNPEKMIEKQPTNEVILQKFKTPNIPPFSDCYFDRKVENNILSELEKLSANPRAGALLVKGGGGLGKTTLMAHLLTTPENKQFFDSNCNLQMAIWLNCFEWRESFDEQDFVFKLLCNVAKATDVKPMFSDLKNMMDYFDDQNLRPLFVFDDMFNAKLLKFFREACPTAFCCVVTREVWEIYLIDKTRQQNHMMQAVVEVPELTDDEVEEALKTTYGIKLGEEQIKSLAKKCLRLPLIIGLVAPLFRWCKDEESYKYRYQEVMKELEDISNSEISENDKQQKKVSDLFQLSISRLADEQDYYRYCAFLTFNPSQMVSLEQLAAFWGMEKTSARKKCEFFEMLSLVRKLTDNNDDASPSFLIHQMLYEANEQMAATRMFGDKAESEDNPFLLRFKLVTKKAYDDLVRSSKINSSEIQETSLWLEIFEKRNRHLLGELVEATDAYHLSRLCMLKGNATGNKTLIHYLYGFHWHDDVEILEGMGRKLVRHSLRIVSTMLRKIRQALPTSGVIESLRNILSAADSEENSLLSDILENADELGNNVDHCNLVPFAWPWRSIIEERKWLKKEFKIRKNAGDENQNINYAALSGDAEMLTQMLENSDDVSEQVEQAFVNTSRLGYLKIVAALYKTQPQCVANVDNETNTALMRASRNGHLEVVKFLYEKYPEAAKIADNDGRTPLYWASANGHLEVVKLLYENYPEAAKIPNIDGRTPLSLASENGHQEVVKFLHDRNPETAKIADNDGRTPLYWASIYGDLEVVKFLVEKYPEAAKIADNSGRTPLALASSYGNLEVVKLFYEKYPEAAKIADNDGRTPLYWASANGHLEVVKLLYEKYPEAAKIADNLGRTPLYWASIYGDLEVVKFLYEKYPEACILSDYFGRMPSTLASSNGHLEVVKLLYEKYPEAAKIPNIDGRTPLSLASENGHLEVVKCLYEKYPEAAKIADNDGRTPLYWASANGHLEVVKLLYEKYPEACILSDYFGRMPLTLASSNGHLEVVKFLYETNSVAAEIPDECGETSLTWATRNRHHEVVSYFTKISSRMSQLSPTET